MGHTLLYNMSWERNERKKERKEGEMGKEGNENGNKIGKIIRREWTAQRESDFLLEKENKAENIVRERDPDYHHKDLLTCVCIRRNLSVLL